ncbi:biotin--[acetyl-CoA-carboxylase] ligase [Actinomyces sp.]|uniref:biotin--[acetyl-CoA-carboxylase] ligase n=1 Tax=Actinomyces sp. TaxID=29317 RepID=UPI0026DB5493|nr:biotin--[acetyl-CoA-carboxylase] ligase [Actinomyces sp.]MDO4899339.1 biotin--[acetyl-CoA-carboxylase] ligase [Actinomyces sp.]
MSAHSPFSRLEVVARTASTNTDLRRALLGPGGVLDPNSADDWPHLSALRAVTQTAGRGRADHVWTTPPTGALTASIVLRPLVPANRLAWLPLLAGLAVVRALTARLEPAGWYAATKWPNDVIALPLPATPAPPSVAGWGCGRKLAGILTELIPPAGFGVDTGKLTTDPRAGVPADRAQAAAVVVGIGINLSQPARDLPVPWAASLTSLGLAVSAEAPAAVLDDCGQQLGDLLAAWEAGAGDPDAGDGALGSELRRGCATLGRFVRVAGVGGELIGTAVDLNPGLVLQTSDDGVRRRVVLGAGDVEHVRAAEAGTDPHGLDCAGEGNGSVIRRKGLPQD